MKSIFIIILALVLSSPLAAQKLNLQANQSQLNWTGKAAFNSYALSGTLKAKQGVFQVKEDTLVKARIVIDMKSLDASNKDLKKHLRSGDFFEVKKYTEAIFELQSPVYWKAENPMVEGLLTIKEQSHPIQFPVAITQSGEGWMLKGIMKIDRTKYGIYYNSPNFFKNLKEQAIANEFELAFELRLK